MKSLGDGVRFYGRGWSDMKIELFDRFDDVVLRLGNDHIIGLLSRVWVNGGLGRLSKKSGRVGSVEGEIGCY